MNSKKTNRINVILSIIMLITLIIILFCGEKIKGIDIYDKILFVTLFMFNFISAIQNKNYKKMLYWKIILSFSVGFIGIQKLLYDNYEGEIADWIARICFCIIPIILAIINLFLIKKNKPKIIQVISYIVIILLSILALLKIWNFEILRYIGIIWCVISTIMIFIYIHLQEENTESKIRKIANILMYYIIQSIISLGILIIVIYLIISSKVNYNKLKSEVTEITNKIYEQNNYLKEEFIKVEKDSKFGLINEKGEEIIKPEYDVIAIVLNMSDISRKIAFAKKDDEFYIILNNKDIINLNNENNYFFELYEDYYNKYNPKNKSELEKVLLETGFYYINLFEEVKEYENDKDEIDYSVEDDEIMADDVEYDDEDNYVYSYNLKNGLKMIITEIENDEYEYEYNIITKKDNEIIQNDKNVIIPIDSEGTIKLYSNGNIPFCNLEKNIQGWYDATTGKVSTLQGNYQILDATNNNYLIVRDYNTNERNEMIVDGKTGNVIALGKYIDKVEDGFIVTDKTNKMYFIGNNNVKSQEFDFLEDISTKQTTLFVGTNKTKKSIECKMIDSKGNTLTKQNYTKIDTMYGTSQLENKKRKKGYFEFDKIYINYYKKMNPSYLKEIKYKIPDTMKDYYKSENSYDNTILYEFSGFMNEFDEPDQMSFSKTEKSYKNIEEYLKEEYGINLEDVEITEEKINGLNWNKVFYNSIIENDKVIYIYVAKDGNCYYDFLYADYKDNNSDNVEQIKNSLILK